MSDKYISKVKVLYVEDDDVIRESLSKLLKRKVKQVLAVSSAKKALDIFDEFMPDIILSDVRMSGLSGFQLIEEVRKKGYDTPVIITSAHSDSENLLSALKLGVDGYILKPIDTKTLLDRIELSAKTTIVERERDEFANIVKNVLNYNKDIILVFEANKIVFENQALLDFFGVNSLEEFRMKYSSLLEQFIGKEGYFSKSVMQDEHFIETLMKVDALDRVVLLKDKDKNVKRFLCNATYIQNNKYLLSLTDITLLDEAKDKYKTKATIDQLTGAVNKAKFNDILLEAMTKYKIRSKKFSLIMCDIDNFKKINDTYGHLVGDDVLKEFVNIFMETIRANDIVARWGGEEFAIILNETGIVSASRVAENLRESIEKHDFIGVGHLTCSFGVGEYSNESKDEFMQIVDRRLYVAKSNGRNKVVSKTTLF